MTLKGRGDLAQLLLDAFSDRELPILWTLTFGPEAMAALKTDTHAVLVHEAVDQLVRQKTADAIFFAKLVQLRPRRADEIWGVAREWGVSPQATAPESKPPEGLPEPGMKPAAGIVGLRRSRLILAVGGSVGFVGSILLGVLLGRYTAGSDPPQGPTPALQTCDNSLLDDVAELAQTCESGLNNLRAAAKYATTVERLTLEIDGAYSICQSLFRTAEKVSKR